MTPNLIEHSRQIILSNQQPSGAYPACPTMPDYQFCWFRDGSFIAHAMLLSGETGSALAFHRWAAQTILRYEAGAHWAMSDFSDGKKPDAHDVLRARYTYDGGKGPDNWPEFQLDGLGTWLWTLKVFQGIGNSLDSEMCQAAELAADYLAVLWPSPCHDLWEEFGDRVHTYTLGAIFAGLQAGADLLDRPELQRTAEAVRQYIYSNCTTPDRGFIKSVGVDLADGSLTALAIPYGVVELDDPLMLATIRRIEADLYVKGRGIHRYVNDSYYGGGAWLLLATWLAWYYAERGDTERARGILVDIGALATAEGQLPEQVVPPMLAAASYYDDWVRMRGPIATPLLWSHAMALIAAHACESHR